MSEPRCKCGTDAMGGCRIHNADAFRRLEAENARLREALEQIAEAEALDYPRPWWSLDITRVAREALHPGEKP